MFRHMTAFLARQFLANDIEVYRETLTSVGVMSSILGKHTLILMLIGLRPCCRPLFHFVELPYFTV